MPLSSTHHLVLEHFVSHTDFSSGAVILDLDGTALLEDKGKVVISSSVERAAHEIVDLGRPVILNTLRFPLSVIRTVGREWLDVLGERIPVVLLNGSQIGFVARQGDSVTFEELVSFPLLSEHIHGIIRAIQELLDNNIRDLILFYYPRNWREGEVIWTPDENRIPGLIQKFKSASHVVSSNLRELYRNMQRAEPCMALVLVDRPQDELMAYQHSQPSVFHTRPGIDKTYGTRELAKHLGFMTKDSIGAGDTMMDTFLGEVGLALIVGNDPLPFRGVRETVVVDGPGELGEFLHAFVGLIRRNNDHV